MKKKNRKAEKVDESALEGNLWIETVHWTGRRGVREFSSREDDELISGKSREAASKEGVMTDSVVYS